jgi:hypothetical protein
MVTQKRKLRDRKQKFRKLYIVLGLMLLGGVVAYFFSLSLFLPKEFISPLSSAVTTESSYEDDEKIDLIREALKKEKIEVVSIVHKNDVFIVELKNNAEVVLSAKKDVTSQISSLQFILSRLTMEGRRFSRLDLTFDKPVIVLEK